MTKRRVFLPGDQWIRHNVKCCACGRAMKTSPHINLVALGKRATWKYPAAGNVITGQPCIEAIAIVCDVCIEQKISSLYAVEWDTKGTTVTYHEVNELEALEYASKL